MTEWNTVKISDIGNIVTGKTPKTSVSEFYGGSTPFLTPSDDMMVKYVQETKKHLTIEGKNSVKNVILPKDSVCVSCIGSDLGKVVITTEETVTNQQINSIIVNKEKYDVDFIYYSMIILGQILNYHSKTSTAVPIVNKTSFSEYTIQCPELKLQKEISCILSAIDEKIKLNTEINNNLEQQAQALFKSWFTDNPNLEKMQQVPLSELCTVITKGTTPTTLGKPFVGEGINFIKAESILDNHSIDSNKFAHIDEETNAMLKRSIIQVDDIVFTIAGTLGRFALIDESITPANTNQAVAIIRADTAKISPAYLYSCFIGNWHNDYYTKRIQQAVQANLSLTTIKSLPIPLLSGEDMNNYINLIMPIIAMLKATEMENNRLANLRDTVLPKLMSGELDVSEIDI